MSAGIELNLTPSNATPGPGIEISATESKPAEPINGLVSGSMSALPPAMGSMVEQRDPEELCLSLNSGGHGLKIGFKTDDQKKRHLDLHTKLTQSLGHPNARINLSKGYLKENNQVVKYINQDINTPEGKLLFELRQLYHEALGQRYSDLNWHTYEADDRAAVSDSLPFQARKDSPALQRVKLGAEEIKDKDRLREFQTTQKLHTGILELFDKQIENAKSGISLIHESRKNQLHRIKQKFQNLDEFVIAFHAAFPPPDLSKLKAQEKINALEQYRKSAKEFMNGAVDKNQAAKNFIMRRLRDERDANFEKALNEMATELALMGCTTREEYDFGCMIFETHSCQTTPEFFVMRLSSLIANGVDTTDFIQKQFPIAFRGLSFEDDKHEIYGQLGSLVSKIGTELAEGK